MTAKHMELKPNDSLRTPAYITDALGPFDLDPCASETSAIGTLNLSIEKGQDGLSHTWEGFVYCNPPFSQKSLWIAKMKEHNNGILLLPERGSAPWFGPLALRCKYYFVMGRKINFEGGSSSNNLGSVLFLFGEEALSRIIKCKLPGHLVTVNLFRSR